MSKKTKKFKDITQFSGPIRLRLSDGNYEDFKNSKLAQDWANKHYPGATWSIIYEEEDPAIEGGELGEVVVVAQAPEKKPDHKQESDDDRPAFRPHERKGVDKWIGANYSPRFNRAYNNLGMNPLKWPERAGLYAGGSNADYWDSETHKNVVEGGNIAAGMVAAPFIAAVAAETAPTWAPWLSQRAIPFIAKHFVAPTAAGMAWDEAQRAITGTTTTEIVSNWLRSKGWNPFIADMVGGLTNPGYWINFSGTGRYTAPLFNKLGLGVERSLMPATAEAALQASMPKSKFQTKVVEPVRAAIDRNLYKIQALTSPWALRYKPITINEGTLPRFKFVTDPTELSSGITNPEPRQVWDYLLFKSQANNERVFGDAMRLQMPRVNTKFYKEPINTGVTNGIDRLLSPFAAGASATDLMFADSENRPGWLRALEYAALGRYGLNYMTNRRLSSIISDVNNYKDSFQKITKKLYNRFQKDPVIKPQGYQQFIHPAYLRTSGPNPTIYVSNNWVQSVSKPGFNYKHATFDDLEKFLAKNAPRDYTLNDFTINDGQLFSPNGSIIAKRGADGKIELLNETELRNLLSKNIDIVDYNTGRRFTGQISVGDDGTVNIPQEYTDILRGNIDYVQNTLFPGSGVKVFGSSAGVTDARFPHATHDVDFYITQNELNKLLERGILSESDNETYTYRLNPREFGEQGNIDLNVIEQTPEGMAKGIRAEELYRQYFPDEYFNALREFKARQNNGEPHISLEINKTPEELLEAINPSSKTIMDSFDIDFTAPGKGKHSLRSWAHLVYSDPQQVSEGLHQYAQSMLGSRVQLFPISVEQLGNKELNLQALEKLGIKLKDFELERIASDPQRMKNVLDAWYMMDNTAMRYIKGTWPGTTGHSAENFVRSATIWDPKYNEGNARGAGLNTTIGGDSQHSGDLKAFISPRTEYKSTNLLDLIDEINNNFGRNPEASRILNSIPNTGPEAVAGLQKVYDERGWNFLQNGSYGKGQYASATRPFDINSDFVGFAPTRTILHPMVPRISIAQEQNQLAVQRWQAPFTKRRTVTLPLDYNFVKPSALSETYLANYDRINSFYNPIRGLTTRNFVPKSADLLGFSIIPATATGINWIISSRKQRQNDWINNAITQPDAIIQGMSEEDRAKFTQEGIDSLKEHYKTVPYLEGADEDRINEHLYYELQGIYDRYKNNAQIDQ